VRWESQRIDPVQPGDSASLPTSASGPVALAHPALFAKPAVLRTFDSPGFAGMTFFEVHAKSILNKVPAASRLPFEWTINPYRGCSHACRYCFARNTHTYLELGAGLDFDTKVVVKVNAPSLLRKELAKPSWAGKPIAMGTNVDCYQRAEGRYRLMPGILQALTDTANPFSILTKGSLILRDLPLLQKAASITDVTTAVSVGFVDPVLWRAVEPGTPSPRKRLEVCRTLNAAGISCGVLMAPILPHLTDSPEQLAATVRAIAAAGACYLSPIVLHLRPGAREWFMGWLEAMHPELVPAYLSMYARSAYGLKSYRDEICGQVRELARSAGIGANRDRDDRPMLRQPAAGAAAPAVQTGAQLALL
jgi:DNA repair photolyase